MVSVTKVSGFSILLIWVSLNSAVSAMVGHAARVLELSDRFLEVRKDGVWLVKFYAPWCGHCKRLEPIFGHVAQALHDTNIRVAKVDCTRFSSVASEFGIQGYPTIMFMDGDRVHTYNGERTTEEIVAYAKRMNGPAVIYTSDKPSDISGHFFGYFGPREGSLWEEFQKHARDNQEVDRYYAFVDENPPDGVPVVIKRKSNGMSVNFTSADSLNEFITAHRFDTFEKCTRSNFHRLIQTKKWVVLGVLSEDKLGRSPSHHIEFRDILGVVADSVDHNAYQFSWTTASDFIQKLIATEIETPYLIVINSSNYEHHLLLPSEGGWSSERIHNFLTDVSEGKLVGSGGNSLPVRMYRAYFELKTSLVDMWVGNPILTAVIFGLPLGFLSLIVYSICCADFMDEDEATAEAEDQANHEKRD